jgi:hypothetical protein
VRDQEHRFVKGEWTHHVSGYGDYECAICSLLSLRHMFWWQRMFRSWRRRRHG